MGRRDVRKRRENNGREATHLCFSGVISEVGDLRCSGCVAGSGVAWQKCSVASIVEFCFFF